MRVNGERASARPCKKVARITKDWSRSELMKDLFIIGRLMYVDVEAGLGAMRLFSIKPAGSLECFGSKQISTSSTRLPRSWRCVQCCVGPFDGERAEDVLVDLVEDLLTSRDKPFC